MAPVKNGRVVFNEIPTGMSQPFSTVVQDPRPVIDLGFPDPKRTVIYDEPQVIDPDTVPLNGEYIIKTLVLSIDPYMRGRMRDPDIESYAASVILPSRP